MLLETSSAYKVGIRDTDRTLPEEMVLAVSKVKSLLFLQSLGGGLGHKFIEC